MIALWLLILLVGGFPAIVVAQDDMCADCHSDPSLTADRLSGTVSLCVTADSLKGSPHELLSCTQCHADLKGAEFPHGPPKHVDCGSCHQASMKAFMEGFFKKLNDMGYRGIPACTDCHGVHRMTRRADTRRVCGICHRAELKALEASIHGQQGKTPDGRPLSCTSCHEPHFKTRRGTMSNADWEMMLVKGCMRCHKHETSDYLESKHYQAVSAGDTTAPYCISCHDYHAVLSPENPAAATSVERLDNLCASCHKGYDQTLHRKSGADARLMTCVACHTGHHTQMERGPGGVFRETVPATCNRCHGDERHDKEMTAHGKIMLLDESGGPSNCTQCHVYHWRKQGTHEASLRQQCQNCHVKETQEYMRSAHARSREKGYLEPPTCTTCHGERDIQKVKVEMKPQHVIDLCGKCHADRNMALKFQLNPDVVKSYKRTYHGQVYSLGYQGANFATCINCHGNHDIRSQDDPQSLIGRLNIVKTCARCHKDANENFVTFLSHYDPHGGQQGALSGERNVSRVERFMNALLLIVFGFFGVHTILWFVRSWIEHRRNPRRRSPAAARKWVQRFSPWQRTLHITLASSFLLQAMTGLPLKFSHSEISYWIAGHVLGLHNMAILHRVGAGIMIGTFVLHLLSVLYLWLVKRRKGMWSGEHSLMPRLQDLKDMIAHFKWFLWAGARPRFGRWTYWEKFDYFAVFWGVLVIGGSGLVLWFPEFFTRNLPGWIINLAHIVHSEEALLATGFIFTIHFFNGHLRPGKFPFDDVIFSGRESTEEIAHERPREFALLEASGQLESHLVPAMKPWRLRALHVYGWLAFATGIILLIFIIASTVF